MKSVTPDQYKLDYIEPYSIGIPDPNTPLFEGVEWGCPSTLFTPAYWKAQYHLDETVNNQINYTLGDNIIEEVVACLLGGFGIPSEHGVAMFQKLKSKKLIVPGVSLNQILSVLTEKLIVKGNLIKYRFPNQKAKYIYNFLNHVNLHQIPVHDDLELRDWLTKVPGIGLKTASWITRNYLNSEQVAILDIHIHRAGILAGIFNLGSDLNKDYLKLERIFIDFCCKLNVKPSYMDALMWLQMKNSNRLALKAINMN